MILFIPTPIFMSMTAIPMPIAPACPSCTIGELARRYNGRHSGAVGALQYLFRSESDAAAFQATLRIDRNRESTLEAGPLMFWVVTLS